VSVCVGVGVRERHPDREAVRKWARTRGLAAGAAGGGGERRRLPASRPLPLRLSRLPAGPAARASSEAAARPGQAAEPGERRAAGPSAAWGRRRGRASGSPGRAGPGGAGGARRARQGLGRPREARRSPEVARVRGAGDVREGGRGLAGRVSCQEGGVVTRGCWRQ
jgi:hypothetical protein